MDSKTFSQNTDATSKDLYHLQQSQRFKILKYLNWAPINKIKIKQDAYFWCSVAQDKHSAPKRRTGVHREIITPKQTKTYQENTKFCSSASVAGVHDAIISGPKTSPARDLLGQGFRCRRGRVELVEWERQRTDMFWGWIGTAVCTFIEKKKKTTACILYRYHRIKLGKRAWELGHGLRSVSVHGRATGSSCQTKESLPFKQAETFLKPLNKQGFV